MDSSLALSIITFIYCFAAVLYIALWVFKKQLLGRLATLVLVTGVCGHTAGIIMRWVESHKLGIGHAPFSNMYESLIFFSWTICVLYLIIERKYGNRVIGAFVSPIAFLTLAYASLSPNINNVIQPLVPALKSNWLIAHVITCFIGYAALALSFCISLMYLLKQRNKGDNSRLLSIFPDDKLLDALNYRMIIFGFLFLSAGIITGSVWANTAWGRYWGWDPKETWSLITWVIYAVLLHTRKMRGWEGSRMAYLSIVGFIAVLFTYFGVNYLPGLHSYASRF
jgi:cytochrome c-type biogenesis protein CcsB